MGAAPAFAATPRCTAVSIATANTNRDGSGTVGTLFTAGSSGAKIEEIRIVPRGTTTAGMVRLYLHDGTNYFLFSENAIAAATLSATVATTVTTLVFDNLVLPSGWSIRCSTEKAETFHVQAFGADF